MTLAVKGLMMIMMNASVSFVALCSQPMLVSVLLHFGPSQCWHQFCCTLDLFSVSANPFRR